MLHSATLTATTGPTIHIDQPNWYVQLDADSRALVDQVLTTIDTRAPALTDDERARVFWRALERLGVWEA